MFEIEDIQFTPVLKLDELLRKQHRQYRNHISYLGWHLHWHDCELYPLIVFGRKQ